MESIGEKIARVRPAQCQNALMKLMIRGVRREGEGLEIMRDALEIRDVCHKYIPRADKLSELIDAHDDIYKHARSVVAFPTSSESRDVEIDREIGSHRMFIKRYTACIINLTPENKRKITDMETF